MGPDVLLLACNGDVAKATVARFPVVWSSVKDEFIATVDLGAGIGTHQVETSSELPTATQECIQSLAVTHLKRQLERRGVQHSSCVEKSELRQLLEQAVAGEIAAGEEVLLYNEREAHKQDVGVTKDVESPT